MALLRNRSLYEWKIDMAGETEGPLNGASTALNVRPINPKGDSDGNGTA